ncbi:MAG: hypothetical protein ABW046_16470, partial [Actinoplanes sp.]
MPSTVELRKSNSTERIQGNKKPPGPRVEAGGVDAGAAALTAPPLQFKTGAPTSEVQIRRHDENQTTGLLRHGG